MKDNQVFFETAEIKRLNTQKRLFSEYEHALYEKVLQGDDLVVLDIGCNNGDKTKEKFDVPNVKIVIGLEYHKKLTDCAQKKYGSERFAFYPCNVETEGFTALLQSVMEKHGIKGFDIINLSLVLSHLTDVSKLLSSLQPFLSKNGKLVILESDDSLVELMPDTQSLLGGIMQCLSVDAFAGDRTVASKLPRMLKENGYRDISITEVSICASRKETEKKKDIYDVFFSYLSSDFKTLLYEDPQNEDYAACKAWLDAHKTEIKDSICNSERVAIGIKLFVAYGG